MKKFLKFILIVFGIFLAISVASGVYQGITGTDLSPKSDSYEVGYTTGMSGAIGEGYISSIGSNAEEICMFLLDLSLNGSPNDGIDWASINVSEFVKGCLQGTREAHPGAEWVS